jgi:4a-hydroxytetrahydrobiopterin dehydratase
MTDRITPREFHEAEGVDDWRVLPSHTAGAYFATGSFAQGLKLADAAGVLAEAANHHPDLELRYAGLMVWLRSHDVDGLSVRDVSLARQISAAARELGVPADPAAVQAVDVTVDASVRPDVMPFWQAVLGYEQAGDEDLVDPRSRAPWFRFQEAGEPRSQGNRLHVDVSVPHDQAEARVAAATAAGGRLVTDSHAPMWWVLADSEGNEARVATWAGRE